MKGTRVIRGHRLGERLILRTLSSGLECGVLERPEFAKKFAVIAARFGSIDNRFKVRGSDTLIDVPAGVAHFLEHKMFDKKSGSIFDEFCANGASVNAFTSYTVTAYHFTAVGNFWANLKLFLRLVRNVHLTQRNVRKEVGIIRQEIRMYEDNPEWRLTMNLLRALYHRHPVRVDTAGTVESVAAINKDTLLRTFRAFYQPANMMLVVAGALDAQEVFERCERLSRWSGDCGPPIRLPLREPRHVREKSVVAHMDVRRPKLLIGFKEEEPARAGVRLVRESLMSDLLLGIMFGKSGRVYLRLYEKGLIDESFSAAYTADRGFGFSTIGGDTDSPDKLRGEILKAIRKARDEGVSKEDFSRTKKRLLGAYLRRFNSLEATAVRAIAGRFLRHNSFRVLDILDSITLGEINRRMRAHLRFGAMAVSIVLPHRGE